jgi:hypothetical protein
MPDYIALQSIQLNGVYAHHAGDVVPEDNVHRLGYDVGSQVAPVGSEQARQVLARLGGGTVEYDPLRYSVDEVNDYLDDADDAEKARVLAAERATQHRRAILEGRHAKAAPAEDEMPGSYDPAEHDVEQVNAYLDSADPAERSRVLVEERGNRHRKGIVEGPHAESMPAPDVAEI